MATWASQVLATPWRFLQVFWVTPKHRDKQTQRPLESSRISSSLSPNYTQPNTWALTVCLALVIKQKMLVGEEAWHLLEHTLRFPRRMACSSLPPCSLKCLCRVESSWESLEDTLSIGKPGRCGAQARNHVFPWFACCKKQNSSPTHRDAGKIMVELCKVCVSKISPMYLASRRKNSSTQKENKLNNY